MNLTVLSVSLQSEPTTIQNLHLPPPDDLCRARRLCLLELYLWQDDKSLEMPHQYPGDQLRDIARKVIIANTNYMNMKEHAEDANSLYFWLDCCCELPGRDGALVRQMRQWLAVNAPGLLDRIPPPATFERRGREVKKETKDRGLVQPALHQTI